MKTFFFIAAIACAVVFSQAFFNSHWHTAEAVNLEADSAQNVEVMLESLFADPSYSKYMDPDGVVLFSTSWCPYCKEARDYLNQRNIEFVEFDVEKDRKARRVYDRLNSDGVPVLLVKGNYLDGFDARRFNQAFGSL